MELRELAIVELVQRATPAELAAILGLAFGRLVALAGLPSGGTAVRTGTLRLVNIAQAAQATGMSRRWFYDHSSEPFMRKLGRSYRVDLAALEMSQGQARD